MATGTLRRHQLVWLTHAGWRSVLAQPRDPEAEACVAHWASHGHPLVVTQQARPAEDAVPATLALGLAAPARWARRKIALQADMGGVARTGRFPAALDVAPLLPPAARGRWRTVCTALTALGIPAHVHGSHGWQQLTGEASLHADSDIDLHLDVATRGAADAAVALLAAVPDLGPRLDGELVFPDGAAVAWREWQAWREGRAAQLLVKRLHGAALEPAVEVGA